MPAHEAADRGDDQFPMQMVQGDAYAYEEDHGIINTARKGKRIAKACDQCNSVRTKCDGYGLVQCTYNRKSRRRGRVAGSAKKIRTDTETETLRRESIAGGSQQSGFAVRTPHSPTTVEMQFPSRMETENLESAMHPSFNPLSPNPLEQFDNNVQDWWAVADPDFGFGSVDFTYTSSSIRGTASIGAGTALRSGSGDAAGPGEHTLRHQRAPTMTAGDSPHSYRSNSIEASSRSSQSSVDTTAKGKGLPNQHQLKYPVLIPLLPHLGSIISPQIACELLEAYFATTVGNIFQPSSPYLLGHVFRKDSFFRNKSYRSCKPVLLASILWVAAQAGERPFFGYDHNARAQLTEKLFNLVIKLLQSPFTHGSANAHPIPMVNVWPEKENTRGPSNPGSADEENGSALDIVITYMHLAFVMCSSELKVIGTPWWHLAFQMAKDMRLNRELPISHNQQDSNDTFEPQQAGLEEIVDPAMVRNERQRQTPSAPASGSADGFGSATGYDARFSHVTPEEREERRRVWWLLYILDRHIALCFNSPLALKDAECNDLLLPMSEAVWQGYQDENEVWAQQEFSHERRGPSIECRGIEMFDFFIAVSAILGQIIEFHHAKSHPRWDSTCPDSLLTSAYHQTLSSQVEVFGRSLDTIGLSSKLPEQQISEIMDNVSPHGINFGNHRTSIQTTKWKRKLATSIQNQRTLAIAYGKYMMQLLSILIYGIWDLECMLNDEGQWWATSASITTVSHAIAAAEALDAILDVDHDLSFNPNFFGIYLLHGAFVLIGAATKFQDQTAPAVLKSCLTFSRAHEVCVVTFHSEYQRKLRRFIVWTLMNIKRLPERPPADEVEVYRKIARLYRWSTDGTGLCI
ncbi:hypothetical protein IFR05_014555 [Cadophora sp. M221]|nr:hypothetical protein IFR05_014555 [Cadophora sp. M221]